jgi:hypothetical protein
MDVGAEAAPTQVALPRGAPEASWQRKRQHMRFDKNRQIKFMNYAFGHYIMLKSQ